MIYAIKMTNQANTKIEFRGYEISIAMDDFCGAMKNYSRTDIRVYKRDTDVTENYVSEYSGDSEDLFSIMNKIAKE